MTTDHTPPHLSRRGRRRGQHASREHILEAATTQFGEHGYQSTTIRKIGEAAGVDAKLVHYYFGTKEDLFAEVIATTFRSRGFPDLLLDRSEESTETPGTRYLQAILTTLEDPRVGPAFIGLARGLGTHEESRRILLRFIEEELLGRLAPRIGDGDGHQRLALAGSQLLGIVFARYILKVPPLTMLTVDELARAVGPTIDRYLTDSLDLGDTPPSPRDAIAISRDESNQAPGD